MASVNCGMPASSGRPVGDPIVVVVVDVLVVDVLVVVVDAVVVADIPVVVVDAVVVVAGSAVPEDEQADAARISATRPTVLRRIGQS